MSDKASFTSSSATLVPTSKNDPAVKGKDSDDKAAKTGPTKMSDSAVLFDKLAKEYGWAATTAGKPSM
ncbi:hypothetical protein EIP91_002228 [Steccherinum ochraceum]|uniref:Uncharacterized protein n=1 Tax=Steccherinum ochraceum TaxID=92696 RepID=A0A4R0RL28_9APHY|nr:hypothetical protein EIP91_002228 [Steccherinum ochraceum]